MVGSLVSLLIAIGLLVVLIRLTKPRRQQIMTTSSQIQELPNGDQRTIRNVMIQEPPEIEHQLEIYHWKRALTITFLLVAIIGICMFSVVSYLHH